MTIHPDNTSTLRYPAPPEPDRLAQDIEIYRRHTEDGVSLRILARELGCHPSTILRRIRRIEDRRDDPLIDHALTAMPGKADNTPTELSFRHALRRLAEPEAALLVADGMKKAIVIRQGVQTYTMDRVLAEEMALKGWIVHSGNVKHLQRYILISAGRAALRRMLSKGKPGEEDGSNHAGKQQIIETREITDPEDGRRCNRRFNVAESPLQLLARHKAPGGAPFLSADLVAAGERLREDFELAQMGPRVTQNWDRFLTAGIDASRKGNSFSGGSDTARQRVVDALQVLDSELGDVALRVCCFLDGLEMTERRIGLPARSGKVLLRVALRLLKRHYENQGHSMIG